MTPRTESSLASGIRTQGLQQIDIATLTPPQREKVTAKLAALASLAEQDHATIDADETDELFAEYQSLLLELSVGILEMGDERLVYYDHPTRSLWADR